jgi:hypothetical protein
MAKARIVMADGSQVNLEGTPSEISAVLSELKNALPAVAGVPPRAAAERSKNETRRRPTVPGLLDELIDEGFFKKPKGIGDVRTRLGDLGHHYPLTSLSGPLQGHVKSRRLRRFKDKAGKYVYAS